MNKKLFLTVDVECHNIDKVNEYIYGKIGNEYFGLEKILEYSKKHDIKINFFVDIVELYRYGEEYVKNILDLIRTYDQPVFLHLHPNFVSNDDSRSFLWQYSYDEQKVIIQKSIELYKKLTNKAFCDVIRIGRYGADSNTYKILNEQPNKILDLTYCYHFTSMCHYDNENMNRPFNINNVSVLPNTRYCGLNFFNKKFYLNLDLDGTSFSIYKRIMSNKNLKYYVCTLHSWYFIKNNNKKLKPYKSLMKRFDRFIEYAKKENIEIAELNANYSFELTEDDALYEKNVIKRILIYIGTFFRMQKLAKNNKKYFVLYAIIYLSIVLIVSLLVILLWRF